MKPITTFAEVMKKLFIIVLMIVYGLTSSGMIVSLHYCCDKLNGISFSGQQDKSCKMGNHVKKSGCCNSKKFSTSLTSKLQIEAKWVHSAKQTIATPVYNAISASFKDFIVSIEKPARGTPVHVTTIPLFIKNCVFRV